MMKKKRLGSWMFIIISIIALTGCLNNNNATPTTKEDGATGGTLEVYDVTMISTWAEGSTQFDNDKRFVEWVGKISNGQLNVSLHQVGELAQYTEVLDTVGNGTVEMGGDAGLYWAGKNSAFDLLGGLPGMTGIDAMTWVYQGGGLELYNEIYGKYNLVYFPHTFSGAESGIRSNKPIKSLEDLSGLNVRFVGLTPTSIIKEFGANPVSIPIHEIYDALQKGVVDAAELSSPWSDDLANLQEVTEYIYTPGWYQTTAVYGVSINKDHWESLPGHLQTAIEAAAKVTAAERSTESVWQDAISTNNMVNDDGIIINRMTDEDAQRVIETSRKVHDQFAAENPDFKKVYESMTNYMETMEIYRDAYAPWVFGSNNTPQLQE